MTALDTSLIKDCKEMFLPLGPGSNFGYHDDPILNNTEEKESVGRRLETVERLATQQQMMRLKS